METSGGTPDTARPEPALGLTLPPSHPGRPHWLLPIAAVCFVMGALLAVQLRTQQETLKIIRAPGPVYGLLASSQDQLKKQTEQIRDLQNTVSKYERAAASEQALLSVMNDELQSHKSLLGLTKVKGPGIMLVLDDSTLRMGESKDKDLQEMLLVHSSDLLQITNELWAAGAEAVAIGNQRIIANTPLRCVGPVVHVNAVPIPSPYTIKAIGDPEVLTSALNLRGGVLDTLRSLKYSVKLVQQQEIVLPMVTMQPKLKLARPVVEKVAEAASEGRG